MENLNYIESAMLVWIQEHLRFPAFDIVMPYISKLNNAGTIAIITVLILLIWKKHRVVGVTAFCSLAVEYFFVNILIKPLVCRTRPFYVNETLQFLGTKPLDYSFPSGHSGAAFAVASVLLFCTPKKCGVPAIIVASLIAFSRLYNGVHYPTDVLAGILIGLTTGFVASKLIFPKVSAWFLQHKKAK